MASGQVSIDTWTSTLVSGRDLGSFNFSVTVGTDGIRVPCTVGLPQPDRLLRWHFD